MKSIIIILLLLFSQDLMAQPIPYGYNPKAGKYFNVDSTTKLYYEIYGTGDPILMLHGGVYGYIDEFAPFIPKLELKYKVICLASRGHVKSDVGYEPYTYNQRADDAFKLIHHLGLKKVTVIGFSDGGFAAYKLAAIYPEVVEKMVVIGAGDDPPKKASSNKFSYSAEDLMKSDSAYFSKRVDNMPEPKRWDESLKMLNDLYNNSYVSKETFEKIKCPVLIMCGDGDEYANPESFLAVHRSLSDSQLSIIPGCGHVVFFCNFPAVWESMNIFLSNKD